MRRRQHTENGLNPFITIQGILVKKLETKTTLNETNSTMHVGDNIFVFMYTHSKNSASTTGQYSSVRSESVVGFVGSFKNIDITSITFIHYPLSVMSPKTSKLGICVLISISDACFTATVKSRPDIRIACVPR